MVKKKNEQEHDRKHSSTVKQKSLAWGRGGAELTAGLRKPWTPPRRRPSSRSSAGEAAMTACGMLGRKKGTTPSETWRAVEPFQSSAGKRGAIE
jgi:hypothetical protein